MAKKKVNPKRDDRNTNNFSASRSGNGNPKRDQKPPRKPQYNNTHHKPESSKEVEVNIKDDQLNAEELAGVKRLGKHPNDFAWYNHYPRLAEGCSGANYATAVGAEINYVKYGAAATDTINFGIAKSAPGIMNIKYLPTYGTLDGTIRSPLGRVWAQLYSAMRIKLGSRADYDPTDTLMYVMLMDSAYMVYGLAVKAYGLTNQVSPFNLYVMRKLTKACGFDWNSISKNRANFRDMINQYAIALSKWMVPGDLDLFKRRMWMIQNLFTDSNTAKAQIYSMTPEGFYILQEQVQGDKVMKYKPFVGTGPNGLITVDDLQNWMDEFNLIAENSQDISQMSADIGKAWEGKTLAAALIPESYTTPISYSQEVLSQLENAVLVGEPIVSSTINPDIYVRLNLADAEGPRLEQRNLFFSGIVNEQGKAHTDANMRKLSTKAIVAANGFINLHWDSVTNQDTLIASRGIVTGHRANVPTGETLECVQLSSCGTEVYTRASILTMAEIDGKYQDYTLWYSTYNDHRIAHALTSLWSSFDWAPAFFSIQVVQDATWAFRLQDLDMYAVVDSDQVAAMHYNCIMSEFYSDIYPESVINMPFK